MTTPLKVLILEDNPSDLELLIAELNRVGYKLDWQQVDTGADFLAHLHPGLDLIIADYNLPQYDALQALIALREQKLDIPFIIVSGTIGEDTAVAAMREGASDYLLKDRLGRLGSSIKRVIEQKHLENAKNQAEVAFKEQEKRYFDLVEHANDIIYSIDLAGNFKSVNSVAEKLIGYSREELLKMNLTQFLEPEQFQYSEQMLGRKIGGEALTIYELKLLTKAGKTIDLEVSSWLVCRDGKPFEINGVARNITERKHSEQIIYQQNQLLHGIFNSLSSHLVVLDRDGTIEYTSKSWEEFAQKNQAQKEQVGVGVNYLEVCLTSSPNNRFAREALQGILAVRSRELATFSLTYPCQSSEGELWFVMQIDPMPREHGGLVVTHINVTERMRVEEAFNESELRFQAAFDQAAVGMVLVNSKGILSQCNQKFCEITGYTTEEVIGLNFSQFTYTGDLMMQVEYSQKMLAGEIENYSVERRFIRKESSVIWVNLTLSYVQEVTGEPKFYIGVIEDISVRKAAELDLQKSREELELRVQERTAALIKLNEDLRVENAQRKLVEKELSASSRRITSIVESITDGFLAVNNQGELTYLNRRAEQLLQARREELLDKNIWRELPETVKFLLPQSLPQLLEDGKVYRAETYYEPFNSWFEVRAYPYQEGVSLYLEDISAQKQAEQTLRESEVSFRLLAENSTDMISRQTVAGIYFYVSPACYSLLGYIPSELIGHSSFEFFHPDDLIKHGPKLTTPVSLPLTYSIAYRFRHKNGHYLWLESTFRAIQEPESGLVTELQVASRDVTERHQAELALKARERQQAIVAELGLLALEAVNPAVLMAEVATLTAQTLEVEYTGIFELLKNGSGLLLQAGFGWAESLLGTVTISMGTDSLAGYTLLANRPIIVEDWPQERGFKKALTGYSDSITSSISVIIRGQSQPFGVLVAHSVARRIFSQDDIHFLQAVANVLATAIERKLGEEALREEEERFRQLAENIQEVFWMTDIATNNIIYVSPAYEELWGRSCKSLYAQPTSFFEAIQQEDRPRILAEFEKQAITNLDCEFQLTHSDGSLHWVEAHTFPIYNNFGEVYRVAGIATDVTRRKQTEEEIQQALAKERELNELKSRFISMTSHEFRTPLSTIMSATELLEYYGYKWSDEKKREILQRIKLSSKRIVNLLDDILLIGKGEAGKLEFQPAPIDLVQFSTELVQEIQVSQDNTSNLKFVAHGQPRIALLDEKLLRHIFTNLITNALKYSPLIREVLVELVFEDGEAIFTVTDHGIGIPEEDQLHLFEVFHRASNVNAIQGTGLGLAIAKKNVDLQGGSIRVYSQVGQGTIIKVSLPLIPKNEQ